MKKNIMKRTISLILMLAILISVFSVSAFAASETNYVEIKSSSAPLRTGTSESKSVVVTAEKGDCFKLISKVKNGKWYKLSYGGQTVYCYYKHISSHVHKYADVSDGFSVCKCGEYKFKNPNSKQVGLAVAVGALLGPEIVSALNVLVASAAAAVAAGAIADGYVPANYPYIAVKYVRGYILSMTVSKTGAKVEDLVVFSTEYDTDLFKESDFHSKHPYHKAVAVGDCLVLEREGMNLQEANKYLKTVVTTPSARITSFVSPTPLISVYTLNKVLAKKLAEAFAGNGAHYGYGTSTRYDCKYEHNKRPGTWFNHYHLWYAGIGAHMKKVDDAHIFFSRPLTVQAA